MTYNIRRKGICWEGNVKTDEKEFERCIVKLREVGNYEYVGELTILAVAEIYERNVAIYRGSQCLSYEPVEKYGTINDVIYNVRFY